jgi:ribonuclease BN (tRNA processing enzyme)
MKLKFLGCGSAFTTKDYYQSMLLLTKNEKNCLFDCGGDVRFAFQEQGLSAGDVDSFCITHAHTDHCGGLEWLGFNTYFNPSLPRPKWLSTNKQVENMWESTLKGGFGLSKTSEEFFNITSLKHGHLWERVAITLIPSKHCMDGSEWMESYSIFFQDLDTYAQPVMFTGDMIFDKEYIEDISVGLSLIIHDCETAPYKSGVHAHYDDLKTLPPEIKSKMLLYHYQPNPIQNPVEDGFIGFAHKGLEINL